MSFFSLLSDSTDDIFIFANYYDEVILKNYQYKLQLENTFLKLVNKYNSYISNEDFKFKEFDTHFRNHKVHLKLLFTKKEIEERKAKFIEELVKTYDHDFDFEECDHKYAKKYKKKLIRIAKIVSLSRLTLFKDFETEFNMKTTYFNRYVSAYSPPRIIGCYIQFLKHITKTIENENISKEEKNKIVHILLNTLFNISSIHLNGEYLFENIDDHKNRKNIGREFYLEIREFQSLYDINETFADKYFNLINTYCSLSNNKKDQLKKVLEDLTLKFLLF